MQSVNDGTDFYSRWADPKQLQQHMPTHDEREANASVFQSIRLTFENAWAADGVRVLEAGSRGKGTDLGCSDLDVVVHVIRRDSDSSEEEFVKRKLRSACEVLRVADDLYFSRNGRPMVGVRSVKMACDFEGKTVACDVLIGVLDIHGSYLTNPTSQTELSNRNAFWRSPSFSHLQKSFFHQAPPAFRSLCRMAKVWLREGTDVDFKCSYLLELVMLKAFHQTPSRQKKLYQVVFCSFLQLMTRLADTEIFFTTYYRSVTEGMNAPFVVSLSDPTSNVLNRTRIDILVAAAASELGN